jgi:hypothetical protein
MTDPRPITKTRAGLEAMSASEDVDVWLPLLRLECTDFDFTDIEDFDGFDPGILRFVANEEDVVSGGELYLAWGFDYVTPAQGLAGSAPQLRMDNVDRRITQAIKFLPSDADIQAQVDIVLSGDPDAVQRSTPRLRLGAINFDALDITGTLAVRDDSRVAVSSFHYDRATTPALHA